MLQNLAFRDELHQILEVIQHFTKYCSCHLQSEYVFVGHFWVPYVEQAVGGKRNAMNMFGRVGEQAVV
jgi:hypothetical protein